MLVKPLSVSSINSNHSLSPSSYRTAGSTYMPTLIVRGHLVSNQAAKQSRQLSRRYMMRLGRAIHGVPAFFAECFIAPRPMHDLVPRLEIESQLSASRIWVQP